MIESLHKTTDGNCAMCRGQRAEVSVTWQTSLGQSGGDVCECCAAVVWGKMVPGHISMDTFTIVQIDAFDAALAASQSTTISDTEHVVSAKENQR